jgi:hypothetical protein
MEMEAELARRVSIVLEVHGRAGSFVSFAFRVFACVHVRAWYVTCEVELMDYMFECNSGQPRPLGLGHKPSVQHESYVLWVQQCLTRPSRGGA